jgi:hypothetical protein
VGKENTFWCMDAPVQQLFSFREAVPLLRKRLVSSRCRHPGTTEFQTRVRTGSHVLLLYPFTEVQRRLANTWILNSDRVTIHELDKLMAEEILTPGVLEQRIISHSEMLKMRLGTIFLLISWGAYSVQSDVH